LEWAKIGGANCIVVTCPMCQSNLDLLTRRVNAKMGTDYAFPILYFTQLLGLALDCTPEEVGLEHGLVPIKMKVTDLPAPLSGRSNGKHNGALRATALAGAMAESV
jgi:heterodisulfide reductase subunit B